MMACSIICTTTNDYQLQPVVIQTSSRMLQNYSPARKISCIIPVTNCGKPTVKDTMGTTTFERNPKRAKACSK